MILSWYYFSKFAGSIFLSEGFSTSSVRYFVLFLIFLFLRGVTGSLKSEAAGGLAEKVKVNMRKLGMERILTANPVILYGVDKGPLFASLGEGVEAVERFVREYFSRMILVAIIPSLIVLTVMFIDPISAVLMLVTAPVIPFVMYLVGDATKKRVRKKWGEFSWMSGFFFDSIRGMETLKIFGLGQKRAEKLKEVSDRYRQATMGVLRIAFVSSLLLELISTVSTAVIAVEVGLRLLYSKIEFVPAFFVILLAPEFYGVFREFGSRFHSGTEGREAFDRWKKIHDLNLIGSDGVDAPPERYDIEFAGVQFTYPDGKEKVLKGLTFKVRDGEKVALAGRSGVGKSTIFRLLMKIFDPDEGDIFVGGVNLRNIKRDLWLKRISVVPQDPFIFNDTLLNNILIFAPEKSKEEAIEAARRAEIDFDKDLPDGFHTILSSGGRELSGGQRQRIAIARLFLRDSPVVLLDEFTTYLDPETTEKISRIMERALHKRTALIIAHRVETLKKADRVIFIDDGVVAAEGKHEELLEKCKRYRELVGEGT